MAIEPDEATELLIRARGFLERGWCRGALALRLDGHTVYPTSDRAVAWCCFGALLAAGMSPREYTVVLRLETAIGYDICLFNNDQESVEPILAAFDRAIAAGGG